MSAQLADRLRHPSQLGRNLTLGRLVITTTDGVMRVVQAPDTACIERGHLMVLADADAAVMVCDLPGCTEGHRPSGLVAGDLVILGSRVDDGSGQRAVYRVTGEMAGHICLEVVA